MPPVEAMACGIPAVTSTADAVREAVGRAAHLLTRTISQAAPGDALKQIATDPTYLDDYRRRGPAHAATFTWERCARVVHGVYRKVLGLPGAESPSLRAAA